MAERTFNFHGANVTFNDIHDLTGCTIYTGRAQDITPQVEEETTKDGGNSFDHESHESSRISEREGEAQSALCTYIIQNDIKPMEEIEKEMAAAARKSAPALVNYIKQALRLGYIDLRGDNSKVVYETLRDHFGLTYSYNNWTKYYS